MATQDFGQLCPLFNTGVYNELFFGHITGSLYITITLNALEYAGSVATFPSCLRLGRTIVVTKVWYRRANDAIVDTATTSLCIGRQTGSGTAAATMFGTTVAIGADASTYPDFIDHWRQMTLTACMTVHTADCLFAYVNGGNAASGEWDFIFQYRDK